MRALAAITFAALLASCQSTAPANRSGAVDTHATMTLGVNPPALAIWDVGNAAMSDTGGWDPARVDAAAWAKLEQAARALEQQSRRMADARTLFVGAHNDEVEGFASRAEIQAMIDADPDDFRALAGALAEDAGALSDAAAARDVRRSAELIDGLSTHCATCHSRYWEKPAA